MRPQKLTLKNFMPFRSSGGEVQVVDFSNLDLFAITGPTGSGKSSLVDAIVWCLYGRTARYASDSKGVISAGESMCEVILDFTVGPRWFRAVRRTGKTTESGLSEREGEEWIQDTSGSDRLTERIEVLLGLDFASFTKTVILPQGNYAEFLVSEPAKRRELLAKILELGVYARVADEAKSVAAQAKTRAETLREMLGQYLGVDRMQVEQRRNERDKLDAYIAASTAQEAIIRTLADQANAVTMLRSQIAILQTTEGVRQEERVTAQQLHAEATARIQSLSEAITCTTAAREAVGYDANRHEVLKRAVAHLHEHDEAGADVERKTQIQVQVQKELADLATQIAAQEHMVAVVSKEHQACASALQTAIAASGDIAQLTEKLGEVKRWKELRQEQTRLTQQCEADTIRLGEVQQSLAVLAEQEATKEKELRDLTDQRDQARAKDNESAQLELEATHLGKTLQDASTDEKRTTQAAEKAQADVATAERLAQQRQEELAPAEQREQTAAHLLEESRQQQEVAHLRATLHPGASCPVCQSPVQELPQSSPEVMDDVSVRQRAVEAARAELATVRTALDKAHTVLVAARSKKEAAEQERARHMQKRQQIQEQFVGRFPGFPSLAAALSAVQTQRQETAALCRDLEARAQAAGEEKQRLARRLKDVQRQETTLAETLRGVSDRLARCVAQLTALEQFLAPYLVEGSDPETVLTDRRQSLLQREREIKAAEQRQRQEEAVLAALRTHTVQTEGNLGVLSAQREAAVAQVQRAARAVRENLKLSLEAPLPTLSVLDSELAELGRKHEQHTMLAQQTEQLHTEYNRAERQAAALQADLHARERELKKAQDELARLKQDLDEARTVLQTAIRASGQNDIDAEGVGLTERLAVLRDQIRSLRERHVRLVAEIGELERRCDQKEQEEEKLRVAESEQRLATDLGKLLGAGFTDFLSQGAVEALMRDASVHLQRLTQGRYSLDIAYKSRVIELQIVDHEDHRRARPTHSLSGGETFLASLAIALALSQGFREVATGKAGKTSTECLILDEGFGTLDREGLQLVTETLQELRGEERRMIGIITHVEEVAAAMPIRIEVHKGSRTSTVTVSG